MYRNYPSPNNIFGGDVTYTEDHTKEYSLYLDNLPIVENDVRDCFSRYGEPKSLEIYNKEESNSVLNRSSFVKFKDAKFALRVLITTEHNICEHEIRVSVDSSMQSGLHQADDHGEGESAELEENDPSQSHIFRLNDDCLSHLYSYLTLAEQVDFSEEPLTMMQLRQIFLTAGHQLHQIKCFWYESAPLPVFKEVGLNLPYLTKIELPDCNIDDHHIQKLVPLQNLEFIDLSNNQNITGRYLDEFSKLIHLNMWGCLNFHQGSFNNICERGMLKQLNIVKCPLIYSGCFPETVLKLKDLEEFSFSTTYNYDKINKITELENLKVLTINEPCREFLGLDFLEELVDNKSDQLESLSFEGYNWNNEILEYISKLRCLKKLCLICHHKLPDLAKNLINLKQLKYLSLAFSTAKPADLIELFEQLNEIDELDITGWFQFDNRDLFEIAERVKTRGKTRSAPST